MTNPIINKLRTFYNFVTQKRIKIDSSIVGARLGPYTFTVGARNVANFAAAIADTNPVYYLSAKTQRPVAHPVFPVRISWEILKNISAWMDTDLPFDLNSTLVHQSEYLAFRQPIKTGNELTVNGEICAFLPHQRGARLVLKFDYHDKQDRPLLSEFISVILFNVKCTDAGKNMALPPSVERVREDEILWEEQVPVARTAPFVYDGCTDIVYPVHTDQLFARRMGLPDIILQGTATLAMSISIVLKKEVDNDPKRIRIVSGKFTDIVVPPNLLTVRLLKKQGKELYFDVKEHNGHFALRAGYIKTF
jgi:hypothetical protein